MVEYGSGCYLKSHKRNINDTYLWLYVIAIKAKAILSSRKDVAPDKVHLM